MKLNYHKYYCDETNMMSVYRHYILGLCVDKRILKRPDFVPTSSEEKKQILIVKTDSIGDYFLIRNFWEIIRSSKKYKNAEITLIASSAIRGIPEFLDSNHLKQIFYVPHPFWLKSNAEKFKLLEHLFQCGLKRQYDAILFPNFNVFNFLDFNIMLTCSIASQETITTMGEIDPGDRSTLSKFYHFSRIIPSYSGKDTFEFENNKVFFENVIQESIPDKSPSIKLTKSKRNICVINPCAQEKLRCWHPNNYAKLIGEILARGLQVTLIGGSSDKEILKEINNLSGGKCQISANAAWPKIIHLINDSTLYIGNDSGTFHLAAALGVPTICISGGMSWQRFLNYPKLPHVRVAIDNCTEIWIKQMLKESRYRSHSLDFTGNVNTVPVSLVIRHIDELIGESVNFTLGES